MSNIKGNKSNTLDYEQKLKVTKDWMSNPISWKQLVKKHNVSYSAVRIWSSGYEEYGKEFLKNISSIKGQNASIKK